MTQAMHRILVIDDDAGIRNVIRVLLQAENYRVTEAQTAQRGVSAARADKPDLILLDLGLPDAEGTEVIRSVRQWSPVPIVVLSARSMEQQKVQALDQGADDYVTKPFGAAELLARIRAALRRHASGRLPGAITHIGNLELDLGQRTARGVDGEIHLTPIECRLLECLMRGDGRIVTQEQIIREVWGPGRDDDTRNLRVAVRSLRRKLEPEPSRPRFLLTEAGIGYRLRSEVTE
ncbi:MAG: DNA-binding response regulator [Steroidobacteraceae bacterium]